MKITTKYTFLIPSLLLLLIIPSLLLSQSPATIPYQAAVRNVDGSVLSNTSLVITFKIHDVTTNGNVVFEETHNTTSNAQGLININVGEGSAVSATFSSINWGSDAKFLHVLMNAGNGYVDLGTQQMMSVPYALHANQIHTRISSSGDSLFVGRKFVIVPGISDANPQNISQTGLGSVVLPDNTNCTAQTIAVTGCFGQDSLLYNATYYDLVEINGQCWFAENLASSQYLDGSNIPTVATNSAWTAQTTPAYCWYNNSNTSTYGALYNWFAVNTGNLCPTGWHVATDCDWMYLENGQGLSSTDQITSGWRGASLSIGGKFRNTAWNSPNIGATNTSGFSALPGGYRFGTSPGSFTAASNFGFWWTGSNNNTNTAWSRGLAYNELGINRDIIQKKTGLSVRCVKD
jgi:uncharacterized protein (TIGR02145 family)